MKACESGLKVPTAQKSFMKKLLALFYLSLPFPFGFRFDFT